MKDDLVKTLTELKDSGIHAIELDGESSDIDKISETLIGESVKLVSSGHSLTVRLDDIPHFAGDANLEIEWTVSAMVDSVSEINRIRVWKATPKGLRLFASPCIVQVEFEIEPGEWLSVGLFKRLDEHSEFLSTGEVAVSYGAGLKESKMLDVLYEL